jgi:hypothetical protein
LVWSITTWKSILHPMTRDRSLDRPKRLGNKVPVQFETDRSEWPRRASARIAG